MQTQIPIETIAGIYELCGKDPILECRADFSGICIAMRVKSAVKIGPMSWNERIPSKFSARLTA